MCSISWGECAIPYIEREARAELDPAIDQLADQIRTGAFRTTDEGELNYILSRLVHEWLGINPRYADYNAVVGVLECCKLELFRTAIAPYEDSKRVANGSI